MNESNSIKVIDKTNLSEQAKFRLWMKKTKQRMKERMKDNFRSENEKYKIMRLSSTCQRH